MVGLASEAGRDIAPSRIFSYFPYGEKYWGTMSIQTFVIALTAVALCQLLS
jgi:hypothetical protein